MWLAAPLCMCYWRTFQGELTLVLLAPSCYPAEELKHNIIEKSVPSLNWTELERPDWPSMNFVEGAESIKFTKESVDLNVGDATKGKCAALHFCILNLTLPLCWKLLEIINWFYVPFSNFFLLYSVRAISVGTFDGLGPPDLCYITKVRTRIARPIGMRGHVIF